MSLISIFEINCTLVILFIIGFMTNLLSFAYIKSTYDLKQSLYYILAMDSVIGTVLQAYMALLMGIRNFSSIILEGNVWFCTLGMLGVPLLFVIQPFLSFIISLLRYIIPKNIKKFT